MSTLVNLKAKLQPVIVRNTILDHLLGPIGNAIDLYSADSEALRDALNIGNSPPVTLDAIAADYGLVRHYNDTDRIMVIRIMNAIKTHQARGTKAGLLNEGREISLVTPYPQPIRFIVGVSPTGVGDALGGGEWIFYWGDTPEPEADLKAMLQSIIPLHVLDGISYLDAYGASAGYESIRGADLLDGDTYTITNSGFYADRNTLIPRQASATYEFGNIDLGANFADFQWLVDWVDYAAWDVDFDLVVEVRCSPDEAAWNAWTPYHRNQWLQNSELERYAQFKIALTMNTYRSLGHYVFRSFILKGLTENQLRYGEEEKSFLIQPEIGN